MANEYVGSGFDGFLRAEGLFGGAEAVAAEPAIAFQIAWEMDLAHNITQAELARRAHISLSAVERLRDPLTPSVRSPRWRALRAPLASLSPSGSVPGATSGVAPAPTGSQPLGRNSAVELPESSRPVGAATSLVGSARVPTQEAEGRCAC